MAPRGALHAGSPAGLVMFTPLPPQPNGIADYSYELLAELSRTIPCTAVVEDGMQDARAPDGVRVLQEVEYEARAAGLADLPHIYQIGNNPDHVFMFPHMIRRPGIAVVHDPSLHHLLDCMTVLPGDIPGYQGALETEYGVAGRILGDQFARMNLREQRMYFDMPMLRVLLGAATGAIVHSRFAAAKLIARVPDLPVTVVPHQYSPPAFVARPADVRRSLGVDAKHVMFLSLGFVTRAKQVHTTLRALAAIRAELPPFRYVIGGEIKPEELDVAALVRQLGLEDVVITPGYVAEEDFFSLIGAADIVVNLRHPIGGETSGTMIRALGGGACVVVVDRGAFAEIPDTCAVKLQWGPDFEPRLADALRRLATDATLRAWLGANARRTVQGAHAPEVTAAGYVSAIRRAAGAPPRPWMTACAWDYLPPHELARLPADLPLWVRAGAAPVGVPGCSVLRLGDDWAAADPLATALGHPAGPLPSPDLGPFIAAGSVDLAVACLRAEHMDPDADTWLAGLNRVMAYGGILVLNLRRAESRGVRHPLETRAAGQDLLERAGFRVDLSTASSPPGLDDVDVHPALEDERCWRAVKVSAFAASPMLSASATAPGLPA